MNNGSACIIFHNPSSSFELYLAILHRIQQSTQINDVEELHFFDSTKVKTCISQNEVILKRDSKILLEVEYLWQKHGIGMERKKRTLQ